MRFFLNGLMSMLREPALLFVLVTVVPACGGDERKFSQGGGGVGGAPGADGSGAGGRKDASSDAKGDSGGAATDARVDDGPDDAGMVEDTGPPPPPPPPGRPGMSIVAGGTKMKSASYQGVVAAGESPGSNGSSSSSNFKLHGGVIGTTQRK